MALDCYNEMFSRKALDAKFISVECGLFMMILSGLTIPFVVAL